jgi:hypothetical protein
VQAIRITIAYHLITYNLIVQYAIPQFTDVEDKLIGPLTLKQFLALLATGGVVLFFWSIFKFSIFFFVFGLPVALLGIVTTFGKFNGRPLFAYVLPYLGFMSRPRVRIFKRETPTVTLSKSVKKQETEIKSKRDEPTESRLKKLAYILDQKSIEEEKLIEQARKQ